MTNIKLRKPAYVGEDMTTVVQEALREIHCAGGGTLMFPRGHVIHLSNVFIPENVMIHGSDSCVVSNLKEDEHSQRPD